MPKTKESLYRWRSEQTFILNRGCSNCFIRPLRLVTARKCGLDGTGCRAARTPFSLCCGRVVCWKPRTAVPNRLLLLLTTARNHWTRHYGIEDLPTVYFPSRTGCCKSSLELRHPCALVVSTAVGGAGVLTSAVLEIASVHCEVLEAHCRTVSITGHAPGRTVKGLTVAVNLRGPILFLFVCVRRLRRLHYPRSHVMFLWDTLGKIVRCLW